MTKDFIFDHLINHSRIENWKCNCTIYDGYIKCECFHLIVIHLKWLDCVPGKPVSASRWCRRHSRWRGLRLNARHLPQDWVHHYAVKEDWREDKQKTETGIYGNVNLFIWIRIIFHFYLFCTGLTTSPRREGLAATRENWLMLKAQETKWNWRPLALSLLTPPSPLDLVFPMTQVNKTRKTGSV